MQQQPIIGFIGAGNMAGAIIDGMLASGYPADRIWVCDRNAPKRDAFAAKGLHTTDDNQRLIEASEAVVLAVKPQVLKQVLEPLRNAFQVRKPLVISVAASVTAEAIDRWLGGDLAVIRTMPNTPSLVMTGATGLYANAAVDASERSAIEQVFSAIGIAVWVEDEEAIHSITATSGSAPAYFFRFMEAMQKAAETAGLDAETAQKLIVQTAMGAARMVEQTGQTPAQLRQKVCSPKGTTEQAILSFEQDQIDAVVARAMQACIDRSKVLSRELAD